MIPNPKDLLRAQRALDLLEGTHDGQINLSYSTMESTATVVISARVEGLTLLQLQQILHVEDPPLPIIVGPPSMVRRVARRRVQQTTKRRR